MTEYSRMAKGVITTVTGGGTGPINLPFRPDYVEFIDYTAMTTPTSTQVTQAWWDVGMGQGAAAYNFVDTTTDLTTAVTTTGGISTFYAGLSLQYGAKFYISGIVKATGVVTTTAAHGYVVGDVVVLSNLYQSTTTGMPQISNIPFVITAVGSTTTFTINWNLNQSNYTALSGLSTTAYVQKVLFPALYWPGISVIEAITTGTTTTVTTTAPHRLVVGQEVAFRIPPAWGTTQLNSLPNLVIPGSPMYGYVVSVTNALTVVVNINSTGYTAYNSNQPVNAVSGQSFPLLVAVGDVNTGGVQISAGSQLYPPPQFLGETGAYIPTIGGPAIQGAFVNNTAQGFIIGSTVAPVAAHTLYWRAFLHDISIGE